MFTTPKPTTTTTTTKTTAIYSLIDIESSQDADDDDNEDQVSWLAAGREERGASESRREKISSLSFSKNAVEQRLNLLKENKLKRRIKTHRSSQGLSEKVGIVRSASSLVCRSTFPTMKLPLKFYTNSKNKTTYLIIGSRCCTRGCVD